MRKQGLFTLAFMLMLPFSAFADATVSPPPGVTMESAGSMPTPPVCNTNTQKLHWNGTGWQCLAVGHANSADTASSVSGYAKGSIIGKPASWGTTYANCPAGSTGIQTATSSYQKVWFCIKN